MGNRNTTDENVVIGGGNIFIPNTATSQSANGSNTVTISNVAPSGVGTATISKWLKIRSGATIYYIPMWT